MLSKLAKTKPLLQTYARNPVAVTRCFSFYQKVDDDKQTLFKYQQEFDS